jgi:hypothetical protein
MAQTSAGRTDLKTVEKLDYQKVARKESRWAAWLGLLLADRRAT